MNSIRNRLWFLFIINFIITAALAITIIYSYEKNNKITSTLILRDSQIQTHTLRTEILFKTQVQEWKNILLRGHESNLYKKYYQQFKQAEKNTRDEVQLLINLVEGYPKLKSSANNFLLQHKEMGLKYQQALNAYNTSEQNAHIIADQQVRGIDREPIKSLAQIVTHSVELIAAERNTIKENLTQLKTTLAIITVIFLVTLTGGFIFVLRKGIQSPLNDLASHVQGLVEGNKDLTRRLENSSVEELQELTTWFNSFVSNIQTLMLQINEAASNLSSASSRSTVINDQTNDAIKTQQAAIDQVAVAMEKMTQTVQQVANNAQQTADSANTAIHDASTGRKIVLEVIGEINQLTSEVSVTSEAVQHMSEESERIHSILSVITEITDQTNLLALNAAIEAARAGEHGRGFAVVADEVRGLANKTLQATGQITGMIESMQSGVKNSLKAIDSSRSQADKTVAMAQNAKSAIEKITSSVEVINNMNQSVASASHQQSQTAHDINSNILNISASINATVTGTQQDTSNSSDFAQLSMMLSSLINQFKVSEHQQR